MDGGSIYNPPSLIFLPPPQASSDQIEMLKSGDNNHRQTPPPPLKENDKLLSDKLSSKQIMSVEPSFRILYYGGASGSVPFTWESQPGTPKHTFSDNSLPPLTPPPSYQSRENPFQINRSKSSFLRTIFSSKKSSRHVSPSFSWSSTSSGSYSSPSTPMNWPLVGGGKSHYNARSRSVVRFREDEEEENGSGHVEGSGPSTFCFGVRDGLQKKFQGRRKMNKLKNALMSIVGHAKA